jgi:hypothetical protein
VPLDLGEKLMQPFQSAFPTDPHCFAILGHPMPDPQLQPLLSSQFPARLEQFELG